MKRLYRSRSTRILGGVAAGTGEYFGVDVTAIRLVFALVCLLTPQAILAYLLAWVIIPEEPIGYRTGDGITEPVSEGQAAVDQPVEGVEPASKPSLEEPANRVPVSTSESYRTRQFLGLALIGVGAVILMKRFMPSFWWGYPLRLVREWWPLGIILIGVAMILSVIRGGNRH
ncbi:MAG: PspC domain-containing protein [Bacillota bacterium]